MICKRCKETIEVGEACHAEPVNNGSGQHHHFFHTGCYAQVNAERMAASQPSLPFLDPTTERSVIKS